MPSGAVNHTAGVRKLRGSCGRRTRSSMIAAQMMMNALSVPMFTSSATSPIGSRPATTAVNSPRMMVGRAGVPKRGLTFANQPGSRPSRASANQIRAAPSMKANSTLVTPITAAAATVMLSQFRPIEANASDTEASPPRW